MITLTFISFHLMLSLTSFFFFFNDPATPEIYTLSLHDALPICKFEILNFRSMSQDAEKHGPKWAADGDDRVMRVGRFLRKFRLDELPQVMNVFRGEMSFVGPRPERPIFCRMLEEATPFYILCNS